MWPRGEGKPIRVGEVARILEGLVSLGKGFGLYSEAPEGRIHRTLSHYFPFLSASQLETQPPVWPLSLSHPSPL